MKLYELRSKEDWQDILDRIYSDLKMVAAITDTENAVIQSSGERNDLCAKVRSIEDSLSAICGTTQSSMAVEAKVNHAPVIDICEAGLYKFVIPLFLNGEWIGSLTACGCSIPDEKIDELVLRENTHLDSNTVRSLINTVDSVSPEKVKQLVDELNSEFN